MLRENKGITLTVLAVTIIVTGIIITITIMSGSELIQNSKKNKLKSNLYLIQTKAENLLENYLFDFDGPTDASILRETKEKYLGGTLIDDFAVVKNVRL